MKRNIEAERIYHDINYDNYIVQYQGDIESEISKRPGYYVTIINDKYAIVSVKKDLEINLSEETSFETIVYVNVAIMYTLQQISPIQASQADFLQITGSPLSFTGKGVNIAMIDSGIDYLSEEFIDANGETRIECIWDQTIITTNQDESDSVPFGALYRKNEINNAIMAYREGKSPYEILPSKDDIGHGTNMAGIIGATGKNPNLRGVVPDCNFVVVKLMEDFSYEAQFPDTTVSVFNITTIFAALQFLYEYALSNYKPMVIYFPLGSSLGNHKGNGLLEEFIESISSNSGIVAVAGTGNQRDEGGHASGVVSSIVGVQTSAGVMELEVSPEQKHLWVEVWADYPNRNSLEILSPSGESTGVIPAIINYTKDYTFIFEKTSIKINYYFPEENTGDELIRVRFYNLQPGIWRFRVVADYILDGKFNAWIPQKGITTKDTRFSYPDPFGTITNPSNSNYIATIAAYNQNNNNLVNYSGMAALDAFVDRIDVAAGGVNALTVAPNNKTAVVSGTSVAAAVAAGVCGMLFQWGIINGNDPNIYSQTIKAYLAKGAISRSGDIIPNPYWGYGMLNVPKIFENMT